MIIADDLHERRYGVWEGLPFSDFERRLAAGEAPPEGESQEIFHGRVKNIIKSILQEYPDALIISHGGPWQAIHDCYNLPAPWIHPGQVFEISLSKDNIFSSRSF